MIDSRAATRQFILASLVVWPLGAPLRAAGLIAPGVDNGGFESSDLSPWQQVSSAGDGDDWRVIAGNAFEGAYSAAAAGSRTLRQDFSQPIAPNHIRSLTLAVRLLSAGNSPDADEIGVAFHLPNDGLISVGLPVDQSGDWAILDAQALVTLSQFGGRPLTGLSISTRGQGASTPSLIAIDDVRLTLVPEPTALGIAGVLAVILQFCRRL